MQAADDDLAMFAHIEDIHRRIFAAMLSHLDNSIGKIVRQLHDSGVEDNTLIVFLSDNGGPTKELTSSNGALRGGKGELWEGGIRVPFIIRWKDRFPAGRVVDDPVISMDATVTLLDAADVRSGTQRMDGRSLIPVLTNKPTDAAIRPLFWRVGGKHSVRSGDWKLIRDGKDWQLFDLGHDSSESNNVAAIHPERVQQMSKLWDQWDLEQIAPLWK
jgi:arylsulfatase B